MPNKLGKIKAPPKTTAPAGGGDPPAPADTSLPDPTSVAKWMLAGMLLLALAVALIWNHFGHAGAPFMPAKDETANFALFAGFYAAAQVVRGLCCPRLGSGALLLGRPSRLRRPDGRGGRAGSVVARSNAEDRDDLSLVCLRVDDVGTRPAAEPAGRFVVTNVNAGMVLAVAVLDPDLIALLEPLRSLVHRGQHRRAGRRPTPVAERGAAPPRRPSYGQTTIK